MLKYIKLKLIVKRIPLIASLEGGMNDAEMLPLPNEELLEVSPRDFEDSNDLLPTSSFQNDPVDADYDEEEISYMNVSPVSERDHESEESEDEDVSVAFQRGQVMKSPQRAKGDLNAESLCMDGRTLLWDLLQDKNIVSSMLCVCLVNMIDQRLQGIATFKEGSSLAGSPCLSLETRRSLDVALCFQSATCFFNVVNRMTVYFLDSWHCSEICMYPFVNISGIFSFYSSNNHKCFCFKLRNTLSFQSF